MKKSNFILLLLFGSAVFLAIAGLIYVRFFGITALEVVQGNDDPATRTLNLAAFKRVAVRDDVEVVLVQGDFAVTLEGESNLLEYLQVEQQGDEITVSRKKGFRLKSNRPLQVLVALPALEAIRMQGAAKLRTKGTLQGETFRLEMSGAPSADLALDYARYDCELEGAPQAVLTGRGGNLNLDMDGAGSFQAEDLESREVYVEGDGAVSIRVHATERLEARLNGACNLRYRGNPEQVQSALSGACTMDKMD